MSEIESDPALLVDQYAYLCLVSETVTAEQMTARLGIAPDSVMVKGSRSPEHVVPRAHKWAIECREPVPLDQQAMRVLDRVRPVATQVRDLVNGGEINCSLVFVRYFGHESGQREQFGWVLEPPYVALLADMHASIDCDEYDLIS